MKYTKLILTVLVFLFSSAASAEIRAVCGLYSKESSPWYLHMYQPLRFTEVGGESQAVAKFKFRTFPDLETVLTVKESLGSNNRLRWTYTLQTFDREGRVLKSGWRHEDGWDRAKSHRLRYQRKGYDVQCDVFNKFVATEAPPTGIDLERRRIAGGDPMLRSYNPERTADSDAFELFTQMFELAGPQGDKVRQVVGEINSAGYFRQLFGLNEQALGPGILIAEEDGDDGQKLACRSQITSAQKCTVLRVLQSFVYTAGHIGTDGAPSHNVILQVEVIRDRATNRIVRYFIRSLRLFYEAVPPKGGANTSGGRIMP